MFLYKKKMCQSPKGLRHMIGWMEFELLGSLLLEDLACNSLQLAAQIGNGNLWWDGIIETAEKIGVKHYIVEQDNNWIDGCPFKALEFSKNTLAKYMK